MLPAIVFAAALVALYGRGRAAADAGDETSAFALGKTVSQAVNSQASAPGGVLLAVLTEEDIPAAVAVASPSPAAGPAAGTAPTAGAAPSPTAGASAAEVAPAVAAPSPTPGAAAGAAPAVVAAPSPNASPSAAGPTSPSVGAQPAIVQPAIASTQPPPVLDITGAVATVQVSDESLAPEFAASANPARVASMRTVEHARQDIIAGHADAAIRSLSRALSIDPSNPYSYFYLGRAFLIKKNYSQALTFFQRAEIGFTANPAWLGETRGFEGLAYEETARPAEAWNAYKSALQAAPNNRIALTGFGRLAASGYTGISDAALHGPPAPASPPPGTDWTVAPAPAMPPPQPPPAEPPPPVN